jgi:hypothetical protein
MRRTTARRTALLLAGVASLATRAASAGPLDGLIAKLGDLGGPVWVPIGSTPVAFAADSDGDGQVDAVDPCPALAVPGGFTPTRPECFLGDDAGKGFSWLDLSYTTREKTRAGGPTGRPLAVIPRSPTPFRTSTGARAS